MSASPIQKDEPSQKERKRQKPGRPAKHAERDSRADLLHAAIRVFSEAGFANASLKDITDRAGVSVGLVRHYFGSKDALIEATNALAIEELRAVFSAILENLDTTDGHELLQRIHERQLKVLVPQAHLLFYLKHLIIEHPASAQKAISEYFHMLQDHFNRLEAVGALRPDANKVWLTFYLMFAQLGPVFLSNQIEAIIGRSPFDPDVARERGRAAGHLFAGVLR
jgi:AcrR family transcriptional regulator